MRINQQRSRQRGAVLVMFALAMVVLIASVGLAVDIGRMYVARTEAQSYVDARALAEAATILEVRSYDAGEPWKQWDFGNLAFDNVTISYGSSPGGTFGGTVGADTRYVRVRADVNVPLSFLPVLIVSRFGAVSAEATAGLEQITGTGEGSFPYAIRTGSGGPNGLEVNRAYTFRWGNNPGKDLDDVWDYVVANLNATNLQTAVPGATSLFDGQIRLTASLLGGAGRPNGITRNPPNINTWCGGHATPAFIQDLYTRLGGFSSVPSSLFQWTGHFFSGGTANIVAAMAYGYQDQFFSIGGPITIATGVRQATQNELTWVISQDTDLRLFGIDYGGINVGQYNGNGFRMIYVPTVSGIDTAIGTPASATVTGFEAFVLLPSGSYYGNPQTNWCAVYHGGAELSTGQPVSGGGVWRIRLVS